ncbi:hypothetical protein D3C81_681670 [compost metagenome]
MLWLAAVSDQCLELFGIVIRQPLNRRFIKLLPAEVPAQFQLTAINLPVKRQQATQRGLCILRGAGILLGGYEQPRLIETAIELAQVVEHDLTLRQRSQGRIGLGTAQVTQQAVAQAFVRYRAQLLLDGLDRTRHVSLRAELDRVHAGEPTHRAAQVDAIEQVFTAVAFQAHQHIALLGPAPDHARQGAQQQVVDLCAVGGGGVLQQLASGFPVQAGTDRSGMALLVAPLRMVARQGIAGALQLRLPVAQLGLQFGALGVSLHMLCPGLERTGLGRQLQRLPCTQRLVGLLQVFQQHPPRHTVHRQVVDDQQQALLTLGHLDQHGTQQRALFQVQATLCLIGDAMQRLFICTRPDPQQRGRFRGAEGGLRPEAQSQCVMMLDQGQQRGIQGVCQQCFAGRQQYRLVPVMGRWHLRLEEPVLNR